MLSDELKLSNGLPDFDEMDRADMLEFCHENSIDTRDIDPKLPRKEREMMLRKRLYSFVTTIPEYDGPGSANVDLLEQAQLEYNEASGHLCTITTSLMAAYDSLPRHFEKTGLIDKQATSLPRHCETLREDKCRILVFGDTCSGKSLFLNLLLEEDLLYTSDMNATSTVCELHYSDRKKVFTRLWDEAGEHEESVDFGKTDKTPADIIRAFVAEHDVTARSKKPIYSLVKVCWPTNMLKPGIVLVDSPGLNESKDWLTPLVEDYISKSNGTVCIINCLQGVTQSVVDFLQLAQRDPYFNPESMFFICSHIDAVNPHEREELVNNLKQKLRGVIARYNDDHFFSVNLLAAKNMQKYTLICPDYDNVLKALISYLRKSFHFKLQSVYWRIYDSVLTVENALKLIERTKHQSLEKREETFREIEQLLDEIEHNKNKNKQELQRFATTLQQSLVEDLEAHLRRKSALIIQEICTYELPNRGNETLQFVETSIRNKCVDVITSQIKTIEEENQLFRNRQERLIDEGARIFKKLFDEIETAQQLLVGHEYRAIMQADNSDESMTSQVFSFAMRYAVTPLFPVVGILGLAAGIIALPFLGISALIDKVLAAKRMRDLRRDPKTFVETSAKNVLEQFLGDRKKLKKLVAENFGDVQLMVDKLLSFVQDRIEHNRALMHNMKMGEAVDQHTVREYQASRKEIAAVAEELARFELLHFKESTIGPEDLSFFPGETPKLNQFSTRTETYRAYYEAPTKRKISDESKQAYEPGAQGTTAEPGSQGTTAEPGAKGTTAEPGVQQSTTEPGQQESKTQYGTDSKILVYVKILLDEGQYSLRDFLVEEQTLRSLNHPNILTYFGSYVQQNSLCLVTEFIAHSLKDVLDERKDECTTEAVFRNLVVMGMAIADGLQYLHNKKIMHRAVRPENMHIIERSGGLSIKIGGFGFSKNIEDQSRTLVGSIDPTYLAPEMSRQNYGPEIDIYAFGVILWEMWHAKQPITCLKGGSLEISRKCHPEFQKLIVGCCDRDPKSRFGWDEIISSLKHQVEQ